MLIRAAFLFTLIFMGAFAFTWLASKRYFTARRILSFMKWAALFVLAIVVAIVGFVTVFQIDHLF